MIDLALDSEGDLLFVENGAILISNVDQIAQNLAIRLRFILGEWYLNILAGVPYFEYFFIKNPNQIQVENFLKEEIASTQGVLQITSFSSTYVPSKRSFDVLFSCLTKFGEIEILQEIL